MDSEKPRGIAIPLTRVVAADAFLLTRNLSGSFSSGSVPVRAPLTIDDDYDSGSVTEEHNSAISDASSYIRGLDSGTDDDFESVLGEADVETELEDVNIGGIRVHRLLGEHPSGESGSISDFSGGSVIYRPFAGDIDEEASVNYSSLEEESETSDEVEGVSESEVSEADRVSMKAKVVIPRAILSLDDDEFDEILGSDDEEAVLLAPGTAEADVEVRALQFGVMGTVEEPEFSEEEVVGMNYSDKLTKGLKFYENIDEQSLCVPPGSCDDIMVENEVSSVEASMESGGTFEHIIEKDVLQKSIINYDGGGSIHEVDAFLKPGDVEGVEDSVVDLREMGITDKSECSSSVRCDFVSSEEDMVQVKFFGNNLVCFEITEGQSLGVGSGESVGNSVDEDKGLDETVSHLVEQGVDQGGISKESDNSTDDNIAFEADALMNSDEGSIGLGSTETDCGTVSRSEKPECNGELKISMSSESFSSTPALDSVTNTDLEVAEGIDFVSVCGSADLKIEQVSENDGKQEPGKIEGNFPFPDIDSMLSVRSSFEIAADEQISELINLKSDSEPNQISVDIEESSLLPVKDVERIMPENSSVIAYDIIENEMQIPRLNNNHTFVELDEYEGTTSDSREKISESNFQNDSKELSSDHYIQMISEKVKERVEKTQFLKAKLERIIRRTGLCSENSGASKLSLAGGEHQTSLGLDYISDRTKMVEQEGPDDLDFSINILVIGKTGVGKSATVNSIFGETKSPVDAFGVTTKSANYVVGKVGGILVRILDTPGLMSAATEERFNQEVLIYIKKSMKTFPVDVILFINRLDENPDIHLLRIITSSLGSSVWRNTIVVLTHATSNISDYSSYKDFIAQRSSLLHQSIKQAAPELSCVEQSKMPRILLAENNMSSFCGNKTSESTCPDWRLNLLILCCSAKIQSKASSLQRQKLGSFKLFCSLWNVLLLEAKSGRSSHSHDDLEKKKRHLLDCYPEIIWDEQRQECLEQETLPVKNQELEEDKERRLEKERGTVLSCVRARRGRLGFQATKRFGIYLDSSDLQTGLSIGSRGCRKDEQEEEGRILVRMRGFMSVLGLVPMLVSVFTSLYGRKDI